MTSDPFSNSRGGRLAGTLEHADQPATRKPIEAEVADGRLVIFSATGKVGEWSLTELRLARAMEGFSLHLDGLEMRLVVEDFPRFWALVSDDTGQDIDELLKTPPEPPRSQWWRFWRDDSWRIWRARRVPWIEYRKKVKSLRIQIGQLKRNIDLETDVRSHQADVALLHAAEQQLAETLAPRRPISPAWMLIVTALIMALALGTGAADLGEQMPTGSTGSVATTSSIYETPPGPTR